MSTPDENDPVWEECKRLAAQHRFEVYLPEAPNPNNFVRMPAECFRAQKGPVVLLPFPRENEEPKEGLKYVGEQRK